MNRLQAEQIYAPLQEFPSIPGLDLGRQGRHHKQKRSILELEQYAQSMMYSREKEVNIGRNLQYYQAVNEQIQEKNLELVEQVRLMKEKEDFMLQQIAVLQMHYRRLEKSSLKCIPKQVEPFKEVVENITTKPNIKPQPVPSALNFAPTARNISTQKWSTIHSLNTQFCKLIEQSIEEPDITKKKGMRKELAQLAADIKELRQKNQKQDINREKPKNIKGCSLKIIDKDTHPN